MSHSYSDISEIGHLALSYLELSVHSGLYRLDTCWTGSFKSCLCWLGGNGQVGGLKTVVGLVLLVQWGQQ